MICRLCHIETKDELLGINQPQPINTYVNMGTKIENDKDRQYRIHKYRDTQFNMENLKGKNHGGPQTPRTKSLYVKRGIQAGINVELIFV